ncbi:FAD:protein FMN transferase [Vibrio mangrovi]|uniref:FAD:protein FMN transferase n=1 Tax=Vibrio mangrovi TaxID=474394 RepID=A0A1Y6IP78_9VIBR|nr:FAD:protein FMN transferase [Vibrio mangrovi]MDW6003749.1 FAD:protein FMN transferase [Vibrio mangrovi]SMR99457.1 Thiamine biosynthesis lipoprotein ApbE precursor [Vibrio mangrovi]
MFTQRTLLNCFRGVVTLSFLVTVAACSRTPEIKRLEGYAQGTTYHISWWSQSGVTTDEIRPQFDQLLADIDKEFSTYRDDSYISEFNHSTSTQWQSASDDFLQLLDIAKTINQKTQGCYDPTIGPLFNLWGFRKGEFQVPDSQQIAVVKAELGLDKIQVDKQGKRIRKTLPQVQVDFSSMGEGYTIGKLSSVLESHGIVNYLVEFGGDMKIRGHKPDGAKWRIAIERPVPKNGDIEPYKIVTIQEEQGITLDTSGTYRRSFDANGRSYSHILDPRTGASVTHDLVSASVFGQIPAESDAWATAMLCLGPEAGYQMAQQENLEVFFIRSDNGQLIDRKSAALENSKRVQFNQQ